MKTTSMPGATLTLLIAGVCTTSATQAAPASTTVLPGSAPSWAKNQNPVGSTDPATDVGFRVYLGWTDSGGATALAAAVSDPKSPSYRHYLSPTQFRKQFAPAANDVAQVQNWLRAQGFSVQYSPKNGHYICAEGTVAQLQTAFGVAFGNYAVQGQVMPAPSADGSTPSSLANAVKAVIGLDESYQFVETQRRVDTNAPPSAGFRNSPPLSGFSAE